MRSLFRFALAAFAGASAAGQMQSWQPDVTRQQTYSVVRKSSTDPTGGNHDWKTVAPGATETVLDAEGPGVISHVWFTIASPEEFHLKKIVLRMYWDDESSPSVEAPIGDFYGLGLGTYHNWESQMLSVGSDKALNSYFPMPFRKHARITVTNEGSLTINSLYYNIDYRKLRDKLPDDTVYFHAQYRQAAPNRGWITDWKNNGDREVFDKPNLNGADNYVWMEATGHGQFLGVTMSVVQNQDYWWGEGDDMFFVDGEQTPSIVGTGSEDYFLGAWDFGGHPFSYLLYGAPVVGEELAGSRSSVYRFHNDAPIPFHKSFKATIEHGGQNARSDTFYSVAYWYQAEPHGPFPALPAVPERIPAMRNTGGPGNGGGLHGP